MKLNADIIYDGLNRRFPMEMAGPKVTELRLERPVFYDGMSDEFAADHLYITRTDAAPFCRGASYCCAPATASSWPITGSSAV